MRDKDPLAGVLLGTAVGDALGLVAEGMKPAAIARRFGRLDRFRLLPGVGVVSDDTEQAALVAQSLAREPDAERCAGAFRRSLAGWFLRFPWGLGMATLRACCRILVGLQPSGVMSAGNGSTMRAAVVGVFFARDEARRRAFGEAIARVTHTDPRAIEGALFAAELASACARAAPDQQPLTLVEEALSVVTDPSLRASIEGGASLGQAHAPPADAAMTLGNTGFVLHTLAIATWAFVREGRPLDAITAAIAAGGDTDTTAAIVGAWKGALHGDSALPRELVSALAPGPFGERHLRALARDLRARWEGDSSPPSASYSPLLALLRNVSLLPIVIVQGVRTLMP